MADRNSINNRMGSPVNSNNNQASSPQGVNSGGFMRVRDDPDLLEHPAHGMGGVGIVFVEGISNRIAVLTLVDDGSAQKDGTIHPGDLISTVDGVDVVGRPLNEIRRMILGRNGTRVTLGFERPVQGSQPRNFSVSLLREHHEHGGGEEKLRRERDARLSMEQEYKRQIAHLRNENDRLQAELNAERNNQARMEQDFITRSRRDTASMQQQVDEAQEKLQAQLNEARSRLQAQLHAAQEEAARYKNLLSELEVRVRAAEMEARAEAERRAAIEAELQQLRRQLENDRTQLGMRGEYEKVLTVLQSKLAARTDDLHAECLRRERAEEDAARLQEQNHNLTESGRQYEASMRAVVNEHVNNGERLIRDASDLQEQVRTMSIKLQREHENNIRLESALKATGDELRATQDALGEHRRALASMEAHTSQTREENENLAANARDDNMRKKQLGYEVNRLTAENGRLTTAVKDLSLRLDANENSRQRLEDDLLNTRRDAQAMAAELEASRMRVMQLNEELRTLEGLRHEDRRTMVHEVQKLEDRLRCEGDDNASLAFANAQLSAEVTQLRAFAEAAQNRDRAEAVNVERHLHHLHSAADQMHATLGNVMEAKRMLHTTRSSLPYKYGPPTLPATFGPDVPRLPVLSPYSFVSVQ